MNKLVLIGSIFVILLCSKNNTFAQIGFSLTGKNLELPPGENKIITSDLPENMEGSPFLDENWREGSIILNSNDTIPVILLRYNALNGEMQYMREKTAYAIGAPDLIKELYIEDRMFVYLPYKDGDELKKSFFEVLCPGQNSLIVLHSPEVLKSNYNAILNSGNKNDRLSIKRKYYLKTKDNIFLIDKMGKNYIEEFGDNQKSIQEFVDTKRISFKKESDLIEIIKFTNTLK